jgi:oligosaccharide repeat unit polymerase
MFELLFWAIFLLTPISITFLLRLANERLNRVSIVSFTTVSLYLFSVAGTLPLFYQWDELRINYGVTNQNVVLNVLFFSALNILFFLFGVIFQKKNLSNKILKKKNNFSAGALSRLQIIVLLFVLTISLLFFINYISKIDELAVLTAFAVDDKAAAIARSGMANAFPGKYHWYSFFINSVSQFATYTLFANWIQKKSALNFTFFATTFLYSAFAAISNLEKAPLIWLLVGLYLTYTLVVKNGFIELRKLAPLMGLLTAVIVLMYQQFMGAEGVSDALSRFLSRAFSGSIEPAYFYIEYFPAVKNYLYGATFPNPGGVFPFTSVSYTTDVSDWVIPSLEKLGIVGSMPTVFWGEAYVNFGPIGIPIVAFVMGLMVSKIDSFVINKISNVVVLGLYVWMILDIRCISESGFSLRLFNFPLILLTPLVFVLLISGKEPNSSK